MARVESYFTGINTNVPGRTERMPVLFMAGLPLYRQMCQEIAEDGYLGFTLATATAHLADVHAPVPAVESTNAAFA
jgi:hypothetical protein